MFPVKDNIPTERFPVVTVALIAINLLVFVWQLSLSGEPGSAGGELGGIPSISERDVAVIELGAIPHRITHPGEECAIASQAPRRVSLPTYPFERKRFWIDLEDAAPSTASVAATPEAAVPVASTAAPADGTVASLIERQLDLIEEQLKLLRRG